MSWSCSKCGTVNEARSFACAVCAAAPPGPGDPVETEPAVPVASVSRSANEVPPAPSTGPGVSYQMPGPSYAPPPGPPTASAMATPTPASPPGSSKGSKAPLVVLALVAVAVLAGGIGWFVANQGSDDSASVGSSSRDVRTESEDRAGDRTDTDTRSESESDGGGVVESDQSGGAEESGPEERDRPRTTAAPVVTSPPTTIPPTTTIPPSAGEELQRLRVEGQRAISPVDGDWFPQISSKWVGLEADGIVYDEAAILANHERLLNDFRFDDVVLLWSGDFSTFDRTDAWVTVVVEAQYNYDGALSWCDRAGLEPDDCFAKQISAFLPPEETTKYNR